MTKKSKERHDPVFETLDVLLGRVEDMSADEVSSAVAEAGIDIAAARRKLYERVSEMRSKLWEKNADVSSDISSLLAQLRPHDLPSSDSVVAQIAAACWLRDLVDSRPVAGQLEFAAAARNQAGALSSADRDVVRELEEELKSLRDAEGSE